MIKKKNFFLTPIIYLTVSLLLIEGNLFADELTTITNKKIPCEIKSIRPDKTLSYLAGGEERTVKLETIKSIELDCIKQKSNPKMIIKTIYGDKLCGEILEPKRENHVLFKSTIFGEMNISFDSIDYIKLIGKKVDDDEGLLRKKGSIHDKLFLLRGEKIVPMDGAVKSIKKNSISFFWKLDAKQHDIPFSKIFAAKFSLPRKIEKPSGLIVTAFFPDENKTTIIGKNLILNDDKFKMNAIIGKKIEFKKRSVKKITLKSDKILFLSDEKPIAVTEKSYFGEKLWNYKKDMSVGGNPIILNGTLYPKGIGVHSYSSITFDLRRRYKIFHAVVGIDDEIKKEGSVIFKIYGDEKLLKSIKITYKDRAKKVKVKIENVKLLTLVVEYGENLDIGDHADWADARVEK